MERSRSVWVWLSIAGAAAFFVLSPGAAAVPESEPNDVPIDGETLTAGLSGSGAIGASDTDYWVYNATGDGWARLTVTLATGIEVSLDGSAGVPATRDTGSATLFIFQLSAGNNAWIIFASSTGATGSYTLLFEVANESSMFSQGAGEHEPNNNALSANTLSLELTYAGTVDVGIDPEDYFTVHGAKGDYVSMWIEEDVDETSHVTITRVSGFTGGPVTLVNQLDWLFDVEGNLTFKVSTTSNRIDYSIELTRDHTNVYADGKVTLTEAYNDPVIDAYIRPSESAETAGGDLQTGEGALFGESMCIGSGIETDVRGVVLESGDRLDPTIPQVQRMIISFTLNITIPASSPACFHAISLDVNGSIGDTFTSYHPAAKVTGDAAKVMGQIEARGIDDGAAQLALWSVTSGITDSKARQWAANTAMITAAKKILNDANVTTLLNPPAAGPQTQPPPPNGNTSAAAPGGSSAVLMGGILVFGLVAVGAVVAYARRRKKAGPMVPVGPAPGAGPTMGGRPGGPAYPPPTAPGTPYPPTAQIYSPTPPPGYRPQAPPPQFARTVAPAPRPPTAPPPAAPAAAANTMPCPTCSSPVAFYAPSCPSCGMQLTWS